MNPLNPPFSAFRSVLLTAILVGSVGLSSLSSAQLTTDNGAKSDATQLKIHKLDLLLKLLPIAMSKEQFDQLLGVIEKVRDKQRAVLEKEDLDLAGIEPDVDATLSAALTKMVYPSKEMQKKIADVETNMSNRRDAQVFILTESLFESMKKILNVGQMKAMAGSFADTYIDPNAKPGTLKDETKQMYYVRNVLLDPYVYSVLLELEKVAPSGKDTPKGAH